MVATTRQQVVDGGTATVWVGLSLFDEYGNPITAKTADTGVLTYGCLGYEGYGIADLIDELRRITQEKSEEVYGRLCDLRESWRQK